MIAEYFTRRDAEIYASELTQLYGPDVHFDVVGMPDPVFGDTVWYVLGTGTVDGEMFAQYAQEGTQWHKAAAVMEKPILPVFAAKFHRPLPSGGPIVRIIYFDVAGLSNPAHEPYIVVVGVIVHADEQWKSLGSYLSDMADAFVPPEYRQGFAFHATELFSGGKIFPREKFSREWRWRVLDELVAIPGKFDLPIVQGSFPRSELALDALERKANIPAVILGQMPAFAIACVAAEYWMKSVADPNELAFMIMENDPQSQKFMRVAQRALADPTIYGRFAPEHDVFKLTKMIYPMHFEEKMDSSALQVADVCSFVIKRWMMKKPEAKRFYNPLAPYLVNNYDDQLEIRNPPG